MHVITGLGTGGAERMLGNLCIAQRAAGDDPLVVSLRPGGPQLDRLVEASVRVEQLGLGVGALSMVGMLRLARLIRREKPAVIQGWMYHADLFALIALLLSRRRRRTRIYWGVRCSDVDLTKYGIPLRLAVRLCALLSPFVDGVVANSQAGIRVHRKLGYDMRRARVIDNGFDTDIFRPDPSARQSVRRELGLSDEAFVVGSVARFDEMKGFGTLLAALAQMDGTVCVAVGKGTEVIGPVNGVLALGERGDVPRLMAAFDALVSASVYGEGFSNAIGEAMAAGLPVVATDVGDARRIVGEGGIVVAPRDAAALSEAIAKLRDDPNLRQNMGESGRARIEARFGVPQALARFSDLHRDGIVAEGEAGDAGCMPANEAAAQENVTKKIS